MYTKAEFYYSSVVEDAKKLVTPKKDMNECIEECCNSLDVDQDDIHEIQSMYHKYGDK